MTFGLAAHAYRLAGPAADLLAGGLVPEALPLSRVMFECAVTAQWVVQTSIGPDRVGS